MTFLACTGYLPKLTHQPKFVLCFFFLSKKMVDSYRAYETSKLDPNNDIKSTEYIQNIGIKQKEGRKTGI